MGVDPTIEDLVTYVLSKPLKMVFTQIKVHKLIDSFLIRLVSPDREETKKLVVFLYGGTGGTKRN